MTDEIDIELSDAGGSGGVDPDDPVGMVAVPLIAPNKSGRTKWAQLGVGDNTPWHGFSWYQDISYCGIEYDGPRRTGAPPRSDQVCTKCAETCGFVRRRARRGKSAERQRGSRRLGNIVDRMEVAVERSEDVLDRMDAILERINEAL